MPDNIVKVIPLFSRKVYSVLIDDSIGEALKIMYDYSFSQLPVYKDNRFYDLLTTNTITRWLGSCVDDDIFSLKDTKIIEVLKFTEVPDNYFFLNAEAPLTDALERFNEFEAIGKPLDAILITDNGTPTGAPLGIITSTDFPKILLEVDSYKL
jgi:predicted transcriptional regulator